MLEYLADAVQYYSSAYGRTNAGKLVLPYLTHPTRWHCTRPGDWQRAMYVDVQLNFDDLRALRSRPVQPNRDSCVHFTLALLYSRIESSSLCVDLGDIIGVFASTFCDTIAQKYARTCILAFVN